MLMPRLKRTRDRLRTALISVLLIASLFLVGLLSVETFNAVDSHERLANDVLLNYTELAADEFERRSSIIAFRGLYPVIIRLTNLPSNEKLPEPQSLPEIMKSVSSEELVWASTLAQSLFRYDNKTEVLVHNGYALSPAVQDRLLDDLMDSGTQERSIRTFHANYENQDFNFVYSWVEDSYAVGILVDNVTVGRTVEYIVDNFPLLPKALVEGELGNEHILLKVTNQDNQILFEKGIASEDTVFIKRPAESELADLYGGLNLEVGIDPLVADQLVIGGLPQSRLPFLASLWTLTILTIAIALILFRRERSLINLRSDFISRVSHELRTPLTQIIMFAQTLIFKRMRTDSDRDRALKIINNEAQRLSMLVENILQFSRGDKGSFSLTFKPTPLVPLIREITDQFQSLLKDGHCISVTTNITDAGLVHLKGLSILLNLSLHTTKITDAGLVHLKGVTKLQELTLGLTQITDAGLVHLKGLTRLQTLHLASCPKITDAGLVHLKGLANLQGLNLWDTEITDAGLVHLKGLSSLQLLDLSYTQITDAGVAGLKKALPNCDVLK